MAVTGSPHVGLLFLVPGRKETLRIYYGPQYASQLYR